MQNHQDANRPQRIKIIIITIIVAILIFIFGAWLITSAIKTVEKKQQAENQATEISKDDKKDDKTNKVGQKNTDQKNDTQKENKTPQTNQNSTLNPAPTVNQQPTTKAPEQRTDLPKTGPEDLLPTAILMGISAYLFTKNRQLKQQA